MTNCVHVSMSVDDYRFITSYDPERERSASRRDMVAVLQEIQTVLLDGTIPLPELQPRRQGVRVSSNPDLDEFVAELRDRIDECEGSLLNLDGTKVWVHTPKQIYTWIGNAIEVWIENNYESRDGQR